MKKLMLAALLSICALSSSAYADTTTVKMRLDISLDYAVKIGSAKTEFVVVPCGKYTIRNLGITSPNATLSLSPRGSFEPVAIISTVRVDTRKKWADEPRLVFESENGMPVLKQIFVPGEDGYEIISAVAKKKMPGEFCLKPVKAVVTMTNLNIPKIEPVEINIEPPPSPQYIPELQAPEAKPPQEEPPAIKKRERQRKD